MHCFYLYATIFLFVIFLKKSSIGWFVDFDSNLKKRKLMETKRIVLYNDR